MTDQARRTQEEIAASLDEPFVDHARTAGRAISAQSIRGI